MSNNAMTMHNQSKTENYLVNFGYMLPAIIFTLYSLSANFLTPVGVVICLIFILAVHLPVTWKYLQTIRIAIMLLFSISLLMHLLPGFKNLPIWLDRTISVGSKPHDLYLYFDVLLIVLTLLPAQIVKEQPWKVTSIHNTDLVVVQHIHPHLIGKITVSFAAITIASCILLVLYLKLATLDFKLPSYWEYWLGCLFVMVAGLELVFRGMIQPIITARLRLFGVVFSALIFSLFFFPFGMHYMSLCFLLGLGTGYVYYKTQTILSSILIHYLLIALFFFTLSFPFKALETIY